MLQAPLVKPVKKALNAHHKVISVGLTRSDYKVDITNEAAIKQLFQSIGPFDALISTIGKAEFTELMDFNQAKCQPDLNNLININNTKERTT